MWLVRATPGFATSLYLEEISLGSESNRLFLGTDAEKFTLENAICNQWQTLNSPQNITSMAATITIILASLISKTGGKTSNYLEENRDQS